MTQREIVERITEAHTEEAQAKKFSLRAGARCSVVENSEE